MNSIKEFIETGKMTDDVKHAIYESIDEFLIENETKMELFLTGDADKFTKEFVAPVLEKFKQKSVLFDDELESLRNEGTAVEFMYKVIHLPQDNVTATFTYDLQTTITYSISILMILFSLLSLISFVWGNNSTNYLLVSFVSENISYQIQSFNADAFHVFETLCITKFNWSMIIFGTFAINILTFVKFIQPSLSDYVATRHAFGYLDHKISKSAQMMLVIRYFLVFLGVEVFEISAMLLSILILIAVENIVFFIAYALALAFTLISTNITLFFTICAIIFSIIIFSKKVVPHLLSYESVDKTKEKKETI